MASLVFAPVTDWWMDRRQEEGGECESGSWPLPGWPGIPGLPMGRIAGTTCHSTGLGGNTLGCGYCCGNWAEIQGGHAKCISSQPCPVIGCPCHPAHWQSWYVLPFSHDSHIMYSKLEQSSMLYWIYPPTSNQTHNWLFPNFKVDIKTTRHKDYIFLVKALTKTQPKVGPLW